MRSIEYPEMTEVEALRQATPLLGNLALGDAIDCLRDDLISLYLAAEQIHWHLRIKRHERQCWPGLLDQAEAARQLSGNILAAILRSVCMKEEIAGPGECAALLQAVLGLQAENDALAPSGPPLEN